MKKCFIALWRKISSVSADNQSVATSGDIIDSVITINQRDASDVELIDYLMSHNKSLVTENNKLREQVEHAVVGLSDLDENERELEHARASLAKGDTKKAKELYRNAAQRSISQGEQSFSLAADYYMQIGALAYLDNTTEALLAYKKASELDPNNPRAFNLLGLLLMRNNDLTAAENAFKEVESLAILLKDKLIEGDAIGNLGSVVEAMGKIPEAEKYYSQALALHKEVNDLNGMASDYGCLSNFNRRCGNFPLALQLLSESRKLFTKMENNDGVANVDVSEASILISLQQFEKAEELYNRAIQHFKSSGSRHDEAYQYANLGNLYLLWQKPIELSLKECESSLMIFESLEHQPGIAFASFGVARAYMVKGKMEEAKLYAQRSLDINRMSENSSQLADSLGLLASVELNLGNIDSAELLSDEAVSIYRTIDDKEKTAGMLILQGEISKAKGKHSEQRKSYSEAFEIYNDIGSPYALQIQRWIDELEKF